MNVYHRSILMTAAALSLAILAAPVPSHAQSRLYVVNLGSNNVSVVDTQSGSVVNTLASPAGTVGPIAFNSANRLVYLPTSMDRTYLIDPATNSVLANSISGTGTTPISISISPELSRSYISNYLGDVTVIDTTSNTVVASIATGSLPIGSAFHPGLGKAYVVNNGSQTVSVIDVATNTVIKTISGMGSQPADVKIDTVANKAIVTRSDSFALALIDTLTDTIVATLPVPGKPQWVAVDSATHRAYVSYAFPGGLAVVDTVANAVLATVPLGVSPTRMALNASTNRLYVTDRGTNSVYVVDTISNNILSQILVGTDPIDIAIATSLLYSFIGFFQPLDNLPTVNTVQAGRAIPVKFSLNGNQGLNIFAPGYPKSGVINCNNFASLNAIEETVTAGGSTLAYDASTGVYSYVWKSDKVWSGTYRQLTVRLADGTDHLANFMFK